MHNSGSFDSVRADPVPDVVWRDPSPLEPWWESVIGPARSRRPTPPVQEADDRDGYECRFGASARGKR
ncbi:hypothetical protein CH296_02510 [Rhodococcus sp. 14-2496-1d]|jgi:hypothetical protein|nr:hypothetical protein CH296_02510 [Rhodococcus sp. 14-2496-1d]